jgi:glycosyltransferase involved in cell wall biosynthesis
MRTEIYPLITVGIPTYNGGKFISQAIQSLLDQTYDNLEILILDNCSTDNTESIVSAFQKKDNRIKYIRHPTNIGFTKNYNLIPRKASGEYVLFFADDDIYDKNYITLLWEEYIKNPAITIAFGSVIIISPDGTEIEYVNNFSKAKTESTSGLKPVDRIAKIIRYGHHREWSWGIILGLHKKEALLKHPFNLKVIDPGILFIRSVIYEGDIAFNGNAIWYKRTGGLSSEKNYGRPEETIKTKYDDWENEVLQMYYECKTVLFAKFGLADKLKLITVFLRYRFPELIKRNFLFTASFFSFVLVKKPYRFIKRFIKKN